MESIVTFRMNLSEMVGRVRFGGERIVLGRKGKPAAALISVEDLRTLEALEDAADLKAARKARKEKGGVTLEEIEARLAKATRHG